MTINLSYITSFTTALLIGDTITNVVNNNNVYTDNIPSFTMINGVPVSAALEIQSTGGALLISRMTTINKNSLLATNGMMVYDITLNAFSFYEAGGWISIPGVITPTVVGDIASFTNTSGTIGDSGVLLSKFGGGLYIGYGGTGVTNSHVGGSNIAIGSGVLASMGNSTIEPSSNVCIGNLTANLLVNASGNTLIGHAVGSSLTTLTQDGGSNSALGFECLNSATFSLLSVAMGFRAAFSMTQYTTCTLIGQSADNTADDLTDTTALGSAATVGGDSSTVIGANSSVEVGGISSSILGSNSTIAGNFSTIVGAASTITGDNSNALGSNISIHGNNSVAIGDSASVAMGVDNSVALGANCAVNQSNSIILGPSGTLVGIGTSSPIANFDNQGSEAVHTLDVTVLDTPYSATDTDNYLNCFPAPGITPIVIILPLITNANLGRKFTITNLVQGNGSYVNVNGTSGQEVGPNGVLNGNTAGYSSSFVATDESGTFFWRSCN